MEGTLYKNKITFLTEELIVNQKVKKKTQPFSSEWQYSLYRQQDFKTSSKLLAQEKVAFQKNILL